MCDGMASLISFYALGIDLLAASLIFGGILFARYIIKPGYPFADALITYANSAKLYRSGVAMTSSEVVAKSVCYYGA